MRKKSFSLLILSLISLIPVLSSFAQTTETLTIDTYYPAPYGVYAQLQLYPTTAVVDPGECAQPEHRGRMSYDGTADQVMVCRPAGVTYAWKLLGGSTHKERFTTVGTSTFTVPAGVTKVWVSMSGGGGGGAGGGISVLSAGGGGGGAHAVMAQQVSLVSSSVTVTVGAGVAGGAAGVVGVAGGASSFGALLTTAGGAGGVDKVGGAAGGAGGASGAVLTGDGRGGVGGGSIFGAVGSAVGGYGAGGAGGKFTTAGKNGSQGFVLVEW